MPKVRLKHCRVDKHGNRIKSAISLSSKDYRLLPGMVQSASPAGAAADIVWER